MSLADRLASAPNQSQFCTVGLLLQKLHSGPEWEAFAGALSTPGWDATSLSRELAMEGHDVKIKHIQEHRRGAHSEAQCAAHTTGVLRPRNQGDI